MKFIIEYNQGHTEEFDGSIDEVKQYSENNNKRNKEINVLLLEDGTTMCRFFDSKWHDYYMDNGMVFSQ